MESATADAASRVWKERSSSTTDAHADAVLQVQRELEEERRLAEEQQRHAQEAIQAKVAELKAIEAARRQEVRTELSCT